MSSKITVDALEATFNAFNRHDIDGVMKDFADDCVFYTAAGPEVYGNRVEGAAAVAEAFVAVWTAMPDAHWEHHGSFVHGDRAVSEWTFSGTGADGSRVETQGVDLFTVRDGKIITKQAFRKDRPAQKS